MKERKRIYMTKFNELINDDQDVHSDPRSKMMSSKT